MRDIQDLARSLLLLRLLHLHLQHLHHTLRVVLFPLDCLLQRLKVTLDKCRFRVVVGDGLGFGLLSARALIQGDTAISGR